MNIVLLAKSSSGDPYRVEFLKEDDNVLIYCSCKAGSMGQLCKHKTAFIQGDTSMLFSNDDELNLSNAQAWVAESKLTHILRRFESDVAELEKAKIDIEKRIKKLKAELAKILANGH